MALPQTVISQFSLKSGKVQQVGFNFFALMAAGILSGLIALIHVNNAFGYYFLKVLQLILFVALGAFSVSSRLTLINFQSADKSRNRMLLVAVALCSGLSTLYYFLEKDVLMMAFSSSAAFLLPFFLKLDWLYFIQIPGKKFDVWFPNKEVPAKIRIPLNSLLIRLKLTQHLSDVDEKIYTVFISSNTKLGDYFSRFLAEHNAYAASAIEDIDAGRNKYAWEFFKTGFFGLLSRRLDPELTMSENRLKKDTLILIKRFKQPVISSFYKTNLQNETIK